MSSGGHSHGSMSGEDDGSVSSLYCSESGHPHPQQQQQQQQEESPASLSRPKRAQVKNACVNCQRACKKCDNARPCHRCVKYNLLDSCVDSTRKPRKKGIKRGPYKKRKHVHESSTVAPGRASTASARAMARADHRLLSPHLVGGAQAGPSASAEWRRDYSGPASPSPIASGNFVSGAGDSSQQARFRLPPIGSFDYSPPRRPHLASNAIPPAPRAHSEQLPPLHISRSRIVSGISNQPASPLGMLSDVATNSNISKIRNVGSGNAPPLPQPSGLAMSHSMHNLSAKPRFDPFVPSTKHIPLSSSRFDYTYRIPPHIPDGSSYSASPWDSPDPASRSSNMASPALPRANGFDSDAERYEKAGREQAREMDSSCTNSMADVQVRRLSSLLDRTRINHHPPPPQPPHHHHQHYPIRAHNPSGESNAQLAQWEHGDRPDGSLGSLDQCQTSNTGLAALQSDTRRSHVHREQ
ncbi:hypothetical protein GGH95_003033, partial [Coemansia sp. RSA 1836]